MEMSNNTVKHEVLIKQYLRSILDINAFLSLNRDKNLQIQHFYYFTSRLNSAHIFEQSTLPYNRPYNNSLNCFLFIVFLIFSHLNVMSFLIKVSFKHSAIQKKNGFVTLNNAYAATLLQLQHQAATDLDIAAHSITCGISQSVLFRVRHFVFLRMEAILFVSPLSDTFY